MDRKCGYPRRQTNNNLKANKTYFLDGKIICKNDGSVVATSTTMFVPSGNYGQAKVDFILDTTKYKTDTELVAIESLRFDEYIIGEHSDLTDKEQTVRLKAAKIETNLHISSSYSHLIERQTACEVVDTISSWT